MDIRNARHIGNGGIDCEVDHPVYGWIPFTARQDDPEELGRLVYAAALDTAADYVAPPTPDPAEALATQARAQRNALLAESDWTQVADAPVDQAACATYRQALRDVPEQAGFPTDIAWPVAPE
jgi:hypothetical protein